LLPMLAAISSSSRDSDTVSTATLFALKDFGVDIAVDDFGAGYSCLRDPPLPTARSVFCRFNHRIRWQCPTDLEKFKK